MNAVVSNANARQHNEGRGVEVCPVAATSGVTITSHTWHQQRLTRHRLHSERRRRSTQQKNSVRPPHLRNHLDLNRQFEFVPSGDPPTTRPRGSLAPPVQRPPRPPTESTQQQQRPRHPRPPGHFCSGQRRKMRPSAAGTPHIIGSHIKMLWRPLPSFGEPSAGASVPVGGIPWQPLVTLTTVRVRVKKRRICFLRFL